MNIEDLALKDEYAFNRFGDQELNLCDSTKEEGLDFGEDGQGGVNDGGNLEGTSDETTYKDVKLAMKEDAVSSAY